MPSQDLELRLPVFLARLNSSLGMIAGMLADVPDDRARKAAEWLKGLADELKPLATEYDALCAERRRGSFARQVGRIAAAMVPRRKRRR